MSFETAGENLVNRALRQERRSGVPHYVSGQHYAEITESDGEPLMMLSYVDNGGHAVMVVLDRQDDEWVPKMVARAGHHYFEGFHDPGTANFKLSEKMMAAIREAERGEH